VDVFAIPDFKKLLDPFVDPTLKACTKSEKTQLQWIFEAVTPDEYFTHGVRVFYRAYAANEVCEIIEDPSARCGVRAKKVDIFNFPMKNEAKGVMVDGMKILTSLPTEQPEPFPFVKGSREVVDAVVAKFRSIYQRNHAELVHSWAHWAKHEAPPSNSIAEYLELKPLHIPLGEILFCAAPLDRSVMPLDIASTQAQVDRMRSTNCVKWRGWYSDQPLQDHEPCARLGRD
jgi:hypothetical protein